jgi:hypothetical protein
MSRLSRIHRLVITALSITMLTASIVVLPGSALPGDDSLSQTTLLALNVPTQLFPISGVVIPIKRIIYVWAAVPGATQYQLQVNQGTTLILNKYLGVAVCVSDSCSTRHTVDLANGTYKWRVRATVGGVAQAFSSWESYTVSVPVPITGFNSPFTTEAVGWVIHGGVWNLEGSNYLTTPGVAGINPGYTATISHMVDYSTLTYEVRMKRDGCAGNANALIIRGNPVLDTAGWWNTEYTFDYTNSGYFSVWKDYYGSYTALSGGSAGWVYTSNISQGGWNTLKVKADGGYIYFYINDHLVWSGYDTSYSSGRVGIAMYRGYSCSGDKLWVDYAKLETTVVYPPDANLNIGTSEGVPGGDRNTAP